MYKCAACKEGACAHLCAMKVVAGMSAAEAVGDGGVGLSNAEHARLAATVNKYVSGGQRTDLLAACLEDADCVHPGGAMQNHNRLFASGAACKHAQLLLGTADRLTRFPQDDTLGGGGLSRGCQA